MGLFGFFRSSKTKSDWDKEIMSLQSSLAHWQGSLACARKDKDKSRIAQAQYQIAELKGRIANAKIERRNAPKG